MGLLLTVAGPHQPLEHGLEPSNWVQRWSHLATPGGTVLDVACGHGRHLRWFAQRGHAVTGIDQNRAALASASAFGTVIEADIEAGPWPLNQPDGAPRQFDVVVVTNYLWRALWPNLLSSVRPGGLLLYETFAQGQEQFGRPSRSDFLLQEGELLQVCRGFYIVAYEHGLQAPPPRVLQRIAALRPPMPAPAPALQASQGAVWLE